MAYGGMVELKVLTRAALGLAGATERVADERDQLRRGTRLGAEPDVQSVVLALRLGHAADDDYRDGGFGIAELSDKFRSAYPRHDVIGNDGSDRTAGVAAQQRERTLGRGGYIHFEAGIAQHCLTNPELQGIVVNQKNSVRGCRICASIHRRPVGSGRPARG
jgi:hypothetical protein